MPSRAQEQRRDSGLALRLAFALVMPAALAAGIAGGLVRAGVTMPQALSAGWLGAAVAGHAFLMICAFMGTLIGIERAVALRHPAAFAGPLSSAAGGAAMLLGTTVVAAWLVLAASLAFVAVNAVLLRRQRAAHTVLLLVAAVAWSLGSLLHALAASPGAVVPWWFAFLVLTIAAERLEMTRLMRRRPGASRALHAICAGLLLGAALSTALAPLGAIIYGASLSALATWLLSFDIARRTVRAKGLTRYMALCLLLGYCWLLVAGAAWVATALGLPFRDAALHGLALGFVFSMMMGHAPVILPALARVKVFFGPAWYLPLAVLHGTLAVRLALGHFDPAALSGGAAGNALAIGLFAATGVGSALAWRLKHTNPRSRQHEIAAEH